MTFRREIERKYIIGNQSMASMDDYFREASNLEHVEVGISSDVFWTSPGVDFIRLREITTELTVKISDKGSTEDRIEENLITGNMVDGHRWALAAFGPPVGSIEKAYNVYFLEDCIVSVYMVTGREELYLEIEADSLDIVKRVEAAVRQDIDLTREHRSLFNIVFGNGDDNV